MLLWLILATMSGCFAIMSVVVSTDYYIDKRNVRRALFWFIAVALFVTATAVSSHQYAEVVKTVCEHY